jgi:hypothetical protein
MDDACLHPYMLRSTTGLHMRLLIYLLAMFTGFSAAEAARPVSAVPATVDASVSHAYADAAVKTVEQAQEPASAGAFPPVQESDSATFLLFASLAATSPVLRHDVILG